MKKQLLIFALLLSSIFGFSQGIEFEHGTWKEVLAKAQQTNKPIFIDVFTSWCGPCKKMSKDIFPLEQVGKVYNANFICYQIDAEKGDGIDIAKKYNVKAYPTYLFVKGDGILFYNSVGAMEEKDFIGVSNKALTEMADPKSITIWEKEYNDKKNDPSFILDYMNKCAVLNLPTAHLFDEYLRLIPLEDRASDIIVKTYMKEGPQMKVNSFAFENLLKNTDKYVLKIYVNAYLLAGVMNTTHEAALSKNEQLLDVAIKAYDQIHDLSALKQKDEIYMEYYKRTGEINNYLEHATTFCNNSLMKIPEDSIEKKDKKIFQLIEKQISSGALAKLDSTQLAQLKEYTAHSERNKISQSLNEIAWEVFEKASDKKVLQAALDWSKRSQELTPNKVLLMDTYANLLYKLGQKQNAIAKEEEALRSADKTDIQVLKETLKKMNAGVKTWTN